MQPLETRQIQCPYCGEIVDILLDCSEPDQSFIEDCQVCCRPIQFAFSIDWEGNLNLLVTHENE